MFGSRFVYLVDDEDLQHALDVDQPQIGRREERGAGPRSAGPPLGGGIRIAPEGSCYTILMARTVVQLLGPSTGGIRAHVAELSGRLTARGWQVTVAGPAAVMEGVGTQDGVVPVPSGWNPAHVRRARTALQRLLADRPDVIHAHGLKAALVALTVRRRPPVVLTIHNLVAGTHAGVRVRAMRTLESAIIRRADHVITISDEIAARITDVVPAERRSFVLPVAPPRTVRTPVEVVRATNGIAAEAPLVVIVARLHPQKDIGMFLRAIAQVRSTVPTVRALVVGDGPDRGELTRLCASLGLDDVVVFTGHRPNPADEMHAADVVALSSRWEGSPLVVAEYLALGKPLATTAVGTVVRHLDDGVSARIVPVGDDRAFASAMAELLTNRERAEQIGHAGRLIGHDVFDAERLVDGVEAAYRHAAGRTPSGHE